MKILLSLNYLNHQHNDKEAFEVTEQIDKQKARYLPLNDKVCFVSTLLAQ